MAVLRSLLFAALFYPGTLVYVAGCFVAGMLSEQALRDTVCAWSRFHGWLCRNVLGIHSRLEGEIPSGPYLIAVKHESMYETIEMVRLTEQPVVVMKRELTEMPFFGWATRNYGVIGVDRAAGAAALRNMLKAGKAALATGRPVLIFPEGTRVAHGEAPALGAGFAGLYRALGLPVVPIALDSGRLWGRGLVKRPGTITIRVGETIPPGLERSAVEAAVHAAINRLN
ncbi:1-acyl-sn-glycerol-3-phosphate acyltransferase [Sphingomonas lutea]|uniref:1-acyl-sn-glycerol-3-phosphate acyltransferase n=1 Tax=Sphingomonas lutea TaxID=1045317 RepID=A0A7G9SIJ9_9SPHN|nr:lysophospholipid acyltransferase family protein [Sphingomonas lutea]QNN67674.1 1-acyl-sn-glycerol-3-phosphate acyltransferase [Sphingomonas lutea]